MVAGGWRWCIPWRRWRAVYRQVASSATSTTHSRAHVAVPEHFIHEAYEHKRCLHRGCVSTEGVGEILNRPCRRKVHQENNAPKVVQIETFGSNGPPACSPSEGATSNGYRALIYPRDTGIWSSPTFSVHCIVSLHCSASQISSECCLEVTAQGGYRMFHEPSGSAHPPPIGAG